MRVGWSYNLNSRLYNISLSNFKTVFFLTLLCPIFLTVDLREKGEISSNFPAIKIQVNPRGSKSSIENF